MSLADLQRRLQAAILDPRGRIGEPRLEIHRDHFWNRMTGFVRAHFGTLAQYVGPGELRAIVEAYIAAHPPATEHARDVVAALPGFLAMTEPWGTSPVLGALAAYDWRRGIAANAADERALTVADLCRLERANRLALRVRLHRRAITCKLRYRFHAIDLRALPRDAPPDPIPTYVLWHERRWRELDLEEYAGLAQLARGAAIAELVEQHGVAERVLMTWLDDELLVASDWQESDNHERSHG